MTSRYSGNDDPRNNIVDSNIDASGDVDWKEEARASSLPAFPIRIRWNQVTKKWDKLPLTPNGLNDATYLIDKLDWTHANGYGIAMGEVSGLYAFDLDDYKEGCEGDQWMDRWNIPRETRTHETISGGRHLIFSLMNQYKRLPTRAGIVKGLDSRGQGGFIAFGEGYKLIDDRFPAILHPDVCEEIIRTAGGGGGEVQLQEYKVPGNPDEIMAKLRRKINFHKALRNRWLGKKDGLRDTSGSAMDHSMAKLLTLAGFDYNEVVWIILNAYDHGSARAKGDWKVAMRAAGRSAAKADLDIQEHKAMTTDWVQPEYDEDADRLMREYLKRG